MKLLLSVLPYFQSSKLLIPHLGIACIRSYLKENNSNLTIKTLDLRNENEIDLIWNTANLPNISFKNIFVSDIYELPIIINLIEKFNNNVTLKELLEPDPNITNKWSIERSLFPNEIIDKLRKTHFFALKHLNKFENFDIIGFSLYTTNLYLSIYFAILIKIKYPDKKIIFGGPQITQGSSTRELLLRNKIADFLILGEGEKPLSEAINCIQNNKEIDNIIGIKTLNNLNSPDTFSQEANLEKLPLPDYSDTDFKKFNPQIIPIYSNRGCPFRCHFCSEHSLFGKKFKRRSPIKVLEDMKLLNSIHNINEFILADSLINSSEDWLNEFTNLLLVDKEKFIWGGYFRAELQEELVIKMKNSGLKTAVLGVESFSDLTLKHMNKKKVRKEIIDTINFLVNQEIFTYVNLFVGYPDETEEEFLNTLEITEKLLNQFNQKNKLDFIKFEVRSFQLRPFSNIYSAHEKFGIQTNNWKEYYNNDFPTKYDNILESTLCTFNIKNVKINEIWHRIFLMKQLKDNFIVK